MSDPQPSNILMLPAPEGTGAKKLPVASDPDAPAAVVKLDELGPMVVNSDGTVSRIANWANMTEMERERTLRVLGARNRVRMEEHRLKAGSAETEASEASVPVPEQ